MRKTEKSFGKFMLLWTGNFVSAIGSGLTSFGLGVYVFEQTGSAAAMALVTLLAFVPSLLLGPLAGILADRYDRRLLMVLGDSLSALGLLFILVCIMRGEVALWQICVGVTISSVFASLLDPAYKATVTDLLTPEQYTKASGLVQVAGSAKYLISPLLAGMLLGISDIKLLLLIDICTIFVTVASTLAVRKGLKTKFSAKKSSLIDELSEGWKAVSGNRGVLTLVLMTALITFLVGFIQTLFTPMILAFSDSKTLGIVETVAASGMLVTSVGIGVVSIKKGYARKLAVALFFTGVFMALFGLKENIVLIGIAGFSFFATLPFVDTSLDYLIRINIDNSLQGRAWGLIGVISQMGYVIAYAASGVLADYVFTPLLLSDGKLAGSVGRLIGTGNGRGIGFLIIIAGLLLSVMAIGLYHMKSIQRLETRANECI